MKSITDQNVIQEVLGHLANNPTLLSQTDKFNLSVNDFNTRFQKYIFTAISGLYSQGMKKISVIDIDHQILKRFILLLNKMAENIYKIYWIWLRKIPVDFNIII